MATLCSNDVIVQYVTVLTASYRFIRFVLSFSCLLASLTFTARGRVIPVAGGAVLTSEDGMSRQLIPGQTLEGNRLAHVVASTHHHPVAKRLWIWALL